jgi:hypothetical protein
MVAPLNDEGYFVDGFGWLTGKHVSEVPETICTELKQQGCCTMWNRIRIAIPRAGAAALNSSFAWWTSGSSAWMSCATPLWM